MESIHVSLVVSLRDERGWTAWWWDRSAEAEKGGSVGSTPQQYHCTEAAIITGIRKGKVPGCRESPAPVGEVELAELLYVPVATVVVLRLEVEFAPVVLFWESTCYRKRKERRAFKRQTSL